MVTVESLTKELDEARLHALKDEKGASAAVAAIMGKAKLHGLLVDKQDHSSSDGSMTPPTLIQLVPLKGDDSG
jgi:phage terminase small subunit